MKESDSVIVLIPIYNPDLEFLIKQIDSVLSQTNRVEEIVLVDDFSSDKSFLGLIESLQTKIKVFLIENSSNLGTYRSIEVGLDFIYRNSNSKYIALADQDDIWVEDKISKCISKLSFGEQKIVYTDASIIDSKDHFLFSSLRILESRKKTKITLNEVLMKNEITGATLVFKREILESLLPFPKNEFKYYLHDLWIGVYGVAKDLIVYLDEPLIKYRQHSKNQIGPKRETVFTALSRFISIFLSIKEWKNSYRMYIAWKSMVEDFVSRTDSSPRFLGFIVAFFKRPFCYLEFFQRFFIGYAISKIKR